jgi:NADH-quinone oxidoreductase subunit G
VLAAVPGVAFLPALRRSNVHGAIDLGLAPGLLPGRVGLEEGRSWYEQQWGTPLPAKAGLDALEMLNAAAEGDLDVLLLVGSDPIADCPDKDLAARALARAGFVVAIDAFETASTAYADVVLPAAIYKERRGSFTNLEGRISWLGQKVTAPGTARADWMIAAELASRLGGDLGARSLEELWTEVERVSPLHRGMSLSLLTSRQGRDGALPRAGDSASRKAETDDAVTGGELALPSMLRTGPAGPAPKDGAPPAARAQDAVALRLVTVRPMWDGGTLVQRSPSLSQLSPALALRVNPADLQRLGLVPGRVRASTHRGSLVVPVVGDPGVPQGIAVLPFNLPEGGAGELIDAAAPVTEIKLEQDHGPTGPSGVPPGLEAPL